MALTGDLIGKVVAAAIAAAVGAGAALAAGPHSSSTLEAKVDELSRRMGAVMCKLNLENTCPQQR